VTGQGPDEDFCRCKTYGIRIAVKSFVARKFHTSGTVVRETRYTQDSVAMNLRMATAQISGLSGLRAPARARNIPNPRRRLTITVICDPPQIVVIRQAVQKIDRQINGIQPIQSQRV
jgi:hypothetical protein